MGSRNILVIGPVPPPIHGQSLAVRQLMDSELSRNFEFILLNKAILFSQIAEHGNFRAIKVLRDLQLISKLVFKLIVQSPDICYLTMAQSRYGLLRDAFIIILSAIFCPVIVHLHFGDFLFSINQLKSIESKLVEFSFRRIAKAILLSERFIPILDGRIDPERICVIPNGLRDTGAGHPPLINQSQDAIKILFLSNLQPEKGLWDFLLVLGHLKKAGVRFSAVVAGAFPTEKIQAEALKLVSDLDLQNSISLPGEVSGRAKDNFLANADVFVFLPNQLEGQPLVIIEALRAGLPIIATPQGGIPDMVIDGQNGYLVPVHDIRAVADKINELVSVPGLRRAMGDKSREIYMNQHTENVYLNGLKKLFESF